MFGDYRRQWGPILLADDDPDDRELTRDAVEPSLADHVRCVADGQELLDYLRREGEYRTGETPRPSLILLDLNMPKKDGREALAEIKRDPELRKIPVVVLTTSKDQGDIAYSYAAGANSYISKPSNFPELVEAMRSCTSYWFETAELPPQENKPPV